MPEHLVRTPAADVQPSPETLRALHRSMLLIRRFEERVYRLFLEGEIPGTLHQYQGQEAVAVGICSASGNPVSRAGGWPIRWSMKACCGWLTGMPRFCWRAIRS